MDNKQIISLKNITRLVQDSDHLEATYPFFSYQKNLPILGWISEQFENQCVVKSLLTIEFKLENYLFDIEVNKRSFK